MNRRGFFKRVGVMAGAMLIPRGIDVGEQRAMVEPGVVTTPEFVGGAVSAPQMTEWAVTEAKLRGNTWTGGGTGTSIRITYTGQDDVIRDTIRHG